MFVIDNKLVTTRISEKAIINQAAAIFTRSSDKISNQTFTNSVYQSILFKMHKPRLVRAKANSYSLNLKINTNPDIIGG